MSNDNNSSRNRAAEAGTPMAPKSEKTKAVDKGKATNPTGQQAKDDGRASHENSHTSRKPDAND
ncbi:hypothetical protein EON81_11940 [bacterium]|nr:MAG: hypothetical protein EON81_11940 [bacterium]